MSLSYEELTEILLAGAPHFTIEEPRPAGGTAVFRGDDITAYVQRGDHRLHEHKVIDPNGQLVYYRDFNGVLHVGNAAQWRANFRRQKAGEVALSGVGILRDSFRRAIRAWRWYGKW